MTEVEVLNCAVPKKLMALEMAISMAKDDIPDTHKATALFALADTDDGLRLRIWYDADAAPVVPAGTVAKPKGSWWRRWGRAA